MSFRKTRFILLTKINSNYFLSDGNKFIKQFAIFKRVPIRRSRVGKTAVGFMQPLIARIYEYVTMILGISETYRKLGHVLCVVSYVMSFIG